MAPPSNIDAPYNFVPLANWVHIPEWAGQISHDLPFRDGLCGHLDLQITAHTPILVGQEQTPATQEAPGEVHPFKLPDGRYALPGSSLKGMIRSVVEIASFSRMSIADDDRYSLRDISGPYVSPSYTARIRNRVQTGFMQLGKNGYPVITPCEMVRLSHRKLEDMLGKAKPIFAPDRSVAKKYERWHKLCHKHGIKTDKLMFSPVSDEAVDLGNGTYEGVPVFTGQVNRSDTKSGKKYDFVFYDAKKARRFSVNPSDWQDFLFVHGDQATKDAESMSWPGYWKSRYWGGEAIPVFYIADASKIRVAMAYMPRLAGDFSIYEMIGHSCAEHLNGHGNGPWDFAETLFGTVGDRPDACLRGRVTFSKALSIKALMAKSTDRTILNGPKPSYFPNYIQQKADPTESKLKAISGYATYLQTMEHQAPEIRGWKRYPVRSQAGVQALAEEQQENPNVQVILHPLATGSFTSRVHFHNLKPEELGALVWALTWGGSPAFRHSLGMAKSFGYGQISIEITASDIQPNQPGATPEPLGVYCDQFIEHMQVAAKKHRVDWLHSAQIKTLLGMATPENEAQFNGKLMHMRLEPQARKNGFLDAKQAALVLAEYPLSEHPATWQEQQAEREAEQQRLQAEKEQREQQERDRQERERQQAEYEALPEEQKHIEGVKAELERFCELAEAQRQNQRQTLVSCLNKLLDTAIKWPDAGQRGAAADLVSAAFAKIGWGDPGRNTKQKAKQEEKRRQRIEAVRRGDSG